jgi:hypothetical protein
MALPCPYRLAILISLDEVNGKFLDTFDVVGWRKSLSEVAKGLDDPSTARAAAMRFKCIIRSTSGFMSNLRKALYLFMAIEDLLANNTALTGQESNNIQQLLLYLQAIRNGRERPTRSFVKQFAKGVKRFWAECKKQPTVHASMLAHALNTMHGYINQYAYALCDEAFLRYEVHFTLENLATRFKATTNDTRTPGTLVNYFSDAFQQANVLLAGDRIVARSKRQETCFAALNIN